MRTILPPASDGTPKWLAECKPVPGRAAGPVTFGTFGKPYVTERLFWMNGEYEVTSIRPYTPAAN